MATRLGQAIVQWVPVSASGGVLVHALLGEEWLQALVMFPVTAVTGVWAAYTETFVATLRELYVDRGKKDARALVQWLDALDRALRWQLSGFERKYLRGQLSACLYDDVEGYKPQKTNDKKIPLLEDVFVPLELSAGFSAGPGGRVMSLQLGSGYGFFEKKLREQEALDVWQFLARIRKGLEYRQLVILAWGGYGKTTLLRHITAICARGRHGRHKTPRLVPFFIRLRTWGTALARAEAPRLAEFLRDCHIADVDKGLDLSPPPLAWVEKQLRSGRALVLLDGFDEVAEEQREAVSQWIGRELKTYPQATFILSSRPGGYEDYTDEAPAPRTKLFVNPFTPQQVRDFVSKWYLCQEECYRVRSTENQEAVAAIARRNARDLVGQIEAREELKAIARNPLLLNMLANYHSYYPGAELPKRRGELYQNIFKLQLCDRPAARKIEMEPPWPRNQNILQVLALEMMRQDRKTIGQDELCEWLAASLQEEAIAPVDVLEQIVEVSELLVERERQEYEFAHLSFQEFLAATEVRDRQLEEELLENYQEAQWQGTIVLYAALTNPNRLLRGLIEKGTPEAAELAYKCLQETPRKVDEEVRAKLSREEREAIADLEQAAEEVRQVRFQELESLLARGEWREADEETFRIMIRTVGKEEGQYFDREDLENFPCEELRELDRLWVKYSEGAWGFSVQKRVWQECGSPDNFDDWKKFCDRVEWRQGGEWVFYRNLKVKTEPKHEAQLPSRLTTESGVVGGAAIEGLLESALLSRKEL